MIAILQLTVLAFTSLLARSTTAAPAGMNMSIDVRSLDKRCDPLGCADKRLDLSLARPYVRFFAAGTEDLGDNAVTLDVANCLSGSKLGEDSSVLQWHFLRGIDNNANSKCQTFILNELSYIKPVQTFAVQVAASNAPWGWQTNPYAPTMKWLDPMWQATQHYVFDCKKTRTSTAESYIGKDCLIKMELGKSQAGVEQKWFCLHTGIRDAAAANGPLWATDCASAMKDSKNSLYWHIRDVSSEYRGATHDFKLPSTAPPII